jgi:hypothetical protein
LLEAEQPAPEIQQTIPEKSRSTLGASLDRRRKR